MSNLLNDKPIRKLLGRGLQTSLTKQDPPFLIKSAAFFSKRNKDATSKAEFSESVYTQLLDKYHNTKFFVVTSGDDGWLWESLTAKDCSVVCPITWDVDNRGTCMDNLIEVLRANGVRFNIKNVRTVGLSNIQKFVIDNSMVVVEDNDYSKFGILPDKELSFEDMWKKRTKRAWI